MKSVLPFLVMILLIASLVLPAQAQMAANPIYLGARAGLNLAQASLTPDVPSGVSKSFRTGFNGGLYADFGVSSGFFIDAEVLYEQDGLKLSAGSIEQTLKADNIVIPISAKYKFTMEGSNLRPYVFGGGNVGFNTKAEIEQGGTTLDIKDSVESVNYGIHAGVGLEYEVSPGVNILIDGRYGLGLKDVDKTTSGEAKLWNIAILAGVSFKVN